MRGSKTELKTSVDCRNDKFDMSYIETCICVEIVMHQFYVFIEGND